ncbi:MAG: hypothetical protein DI551_03660 [Micavibrio aeruginosavorus]|uniref:DUF47 domain-containing protein n=1 Tax=Micavibrio aeruginosavorus TaxID=349221 RepID=A0A2W5N1G5_9BACT|nr:MAG: hypothetical protein DI551_03660 [Micavibrio aeruginosavorus]
MSILAKLLPQEDKFYIGLRALSANAHEGAALLQTFIETPAGATRDSIGQKIALVKADSKKLLATMSRDVSLSFVTPFDREDIQEISDLLYRIPKTIDKIRERLELHNIGANDGDFALQVDLIVREANAMQEIIESLTRKGGEKIIVAKVAELHTLEENGDEVLSRLLTKLFAMERDVRDLILRKDIYDMLEKVLDRYRDAAAIALQIVLKHS